MIIDGPFVETKEFIAGYRVTEVNSKAEAVKWTASAESGSGPRNKQTNNAARAPGAQRGISHGEPARARHLSKNVCVVFT